MFPKTFARPACLRRDAVSLLGEKRVRTAIATGEFRTPWPGVLVDPRRAADPLTIIEAGLLATGPDARAAGPTAARLHGISAIDPLPVQVMVPYGCRRRSRPGLVVHTGRSLAEDTVVLAGLPALGLDRVVTDILCTCRQQDALAVLDQVLGALAPAERSAYRGKLHERLRSRPDPRGTRVGARLVDLATGAAESPAESWLLWRIVDLGFPVPEVNHRIRDVDGRARYRVDLSWPGLRIAVEYNGHLAHLDRGAEDAARADDLRRRGWIVIQVDVDDLRCMSRVEREVHEAFARRGVPLRERSVGAMRARRHRDALAS